MKQIKTTLFALIIVLGVCMFIYGGYDDSPGGQLLGVVGVGIGIWNIYKLHRKTPSEPL